MSDIIGSIIELDNFLLQGGIMGKIVEYDSKMNELNFGKFKEKEMDLFFSICYKMKNEGLNEVILTFQELKELSNYSNRNLDRFIKDLESTYDKMLNIKIRTETKTTITKIILFTKYNIEKEERIVKIKIHEDGKYLLNDIEKFTKFDLMEFVSLKSSYAKNMFKMLKQFDNEDSYNWYQIKIDDFKVMLDIPKSYKMIDIDKRVLSPIIEQLKPYFSGLKLEKIKKGVKVDSLKFIWRAKKKKKVEEIQAIKKRDSIGEKEFREHQEQIQEIKEEIKQTNQIEKIKVTKAEYEDLYKKYLKDQKTEHTLFTRKGFDIANKNRYEIIENKKQKIQEELVSSIYKIFMIENELEENLESKKLFDEYLEKNYILTNDFESKEEWNNFLEFQDEVLNKEGYLTTKELNQDLTYDEYKEHLESETEDDYNSLGEVLLSNESLKENFQEQKTPLNDETLLEEIKIREQFSELFKNREDYNLAWLKNQIELEELKQILNTKKNKIEVKKLEDIEPEKLLSKKGTALKGGALVARLEKIAKDENIKIQYKDKIIGE